MRRQAIHAMLMSFTIVALGAAAGRAAPGIDGHWVGFEERNGQKLSVALDFVQTTPFAAPRIEYFCPMDPQIVQGVPGHCPICKMTLEPRATANATGRFTSEMQGVSEYPLDVVSYAPPKLHFELGNGDTVFDGTLSADSIAGTIRQKDGAGTFSLRRERASAAPYTREEVTFCDGNVTLAGSLLIPRTGGTHAAIVMVHGSGAASRWGTPLFFAEQFARNGIAALAFDKRGSGVSTGDWRTASNSDLADDVIAGINFLRGRNDIDPEKVGIYGHSEGAMIAPLIGTRSQHVAFIIAAAGHAGPIVEQELYRVHGILLANGFDENDAAKALAFYSIWLNIAVTGKGWDLLDAALPVVQNEKWLSLVEPPARDNWVWKSYPARARYDSLVYWRQVTVPVLIVFGEADRTVNPKTGIPRTVKALEAGGDRDVTAVIIPSAEHNLTIASRPGQPFEWWHVAPGYPDLLAAWVLHRIAAVRDLTRSSPRALRTSPPSRRSAAGAGGRGGRQTGSRRPRPPTPAHDRPMSIRSANSRHRMPSIAAEHPVHN